MTRILLVAILMSLTPHTLEAGPATQPTCGYALADLNRNGIPPLLKDIKTKAQ